MCVGGGGEGGMCVGISEKGQRDDETIRSLKWFSCDYLLDISDSLIQCLSLLVYVCENASTRLVIMFSCMLSLKANYHSNLIISFSLSLSICPSPPPLIITYAVMMLCSGCDGASDVGAGASHVYLVWHWCVIHPDSLHEKPGLLSAWQETQENRLQLPPEEWGMCWSLTLAFSPFAAEKDCLLLLSVTPK